MARNVTMSISGDELIIKAYLDKPLGPSKSGSATLYATTEGVVEIGGFIVSLNVHKAAKKSAVKK